MNIIEKLTKKYNLAPDSYYTESPYKNSSLVGYPEASVKEKLLKIKWAAHIPVNHYGFSLGNPTPEVWFKTIDEFLDYVVWECRDFEILQVSIKFGRLKLNLGKITKEIQSEVGQLKDLLSDKFLIY
jgi:hypothetical protein